MSPRGAGTARPHGGAGEVDLQQQRRGLFKAGTAGIAVSIAGLPLDTPFCLAF